MKSSELAVAIAIVTWGCGQALTEKGYEGEPRYSIKGQIRSLSPLAPDADVLVEVLWVNFAKDGDTASALQAPIQDLSFPTNFELNLLDEPRPYEMNDFDGAVPGAQGLLGIGNVIIVEDTNRDGAFQLGDSTENLRNSEEPVLGFSKSHAVLFAREVNDILKEAMRGVFLLNPEKLQPGFNLARYVCAPSGALSDRLEIIDAEPIAIDAFDRERPDWGCTNIY